MAFTATSASAADRAPTGSAVHDPMIRRDRRRLLLASVLALVGSVTPWVDTAFGNLGGLAGGGLWTLYAAAIGLAGTGWRRPRALAVHAAILAVPAVLLPVWQVARLVPLGGFGRGWMPGFGLVAVFGGGVIAAAIALGRIPRRSAGGADGSG